ncbi:hypothetical protein [Diplocloster modestus]|uniref:Uncharacterized protein n=1 Tax=Diplocloster modestus TaxID=2850322 RepID=A0ABS6KAL8_9FIRM|nr:hypothetical protein [Diplocloster modestus]MBU9727565.1 hypothetical protein [Diplocloster modestus]
MTLMVREEPGERDGGLLFRAVGRASGLWRAEGCLLATAKWNPAGRLRNRSNSPETQDAFPVQWTLPVGREVRRAS